MQQEYTPPEYNQSAFNCPFCNAYARQFWDNLGQVVRYKHHYNNADGCVCSHCGLESIWFNNVMVYPDFQGAQPPNQDLSPEIQADYQEAASILQKSPRGAAALLRLAIQRLCKDLGEDGKNINDDIKNLVAKGLPATVQKSLDIVRVVGNEAVHPGQIDLGDDIETAKVLFKLINLIAEKTITEKREVDEVYNSLPEAKRQEIEKRDSK